MTLFCLFAAMVRVGSNTYPFNKDFYMIINLAAGGNWPENANASTSFLQYLIVDDIRVYKKQRFNW